MPVRLLSSSMLRPSKPFPRSGCVTLMMAKIEEVWCRIIAERELLSQSQLAHRCSGNMSYQYIQVQLIGEPLVPSRRKLLRLVMTLRSSHGAREVKDHKSTLPTGCGSIFNTANKDDIRTDYPVYRPGALIFRPLNFFAPAISKHRQLPA